MTGENTLAAIWEQAKRDMAKEPKLSVTTAQVRELIRAQFPAYAELDIRPVEESGWDNCTFHLGDALVVRLPSSSWYAGQVLKEHAWLPVLAGSLSIEIPVPVALGEPGSGYPFSWSINRWIEGDTLTKSAPDPVLLASDVATFLAELHQCDTRDGPVSGLANFFRGGDLVVYETETMALLDQLGDRVDRNAVENIWQAALASRFDAPPVWVHGDMAAGNLLLRDGRLAAVIDFGCCAVGDPACDLVMAWTWFDHEASQVFRNALQLDDGTWARARGWVLWKTLILLARTPDDAECQALLQRILDDPVQA